MNRFVNLDILRIVQQIHLTRQAGILCFQTTMFVSSTLVGRPFWVLVVEPLARCLTAMHSFFRKVILAPSQLKYAVVNSFKIVTNVFRYFV